MTTDIKQVIATAKKTLATADANKELLMPLLDILEDAVEKASNPALEKLSVDNDGDVVVDIADDRGLILNNADDEVQVELKNGGGNFVVTATNRRVLVEDCDIEISSGKAIKSSDNSVIVEDADNYEGVIIKTNNGVLTLVNVDDGTNVELHSREDGSFGVPASLRIGSQGGNSKIYLNGNELVPGTKLYKHTITGTVVDENSNTKNLTFDIIINTETSLYDNYVTFNSGVIGVFKIAITGTEGGPFYSTANGSAGQISIIPLVSVSMDPPANASFVAGKSYMVTITGDNNPVAL